MFSLGVTADNIDEITSFLKTSDLSKSIRLAARKLYRELVSGKEVPEGGCPKDDYVQCVKEFTTEKHEKKFLISTGNTAFIWNYWDFFHTCSIGKVPEFPTCLSGKITFASLSLPIEAEMCYCRSEKIETFLLRRVIVNFTFLTG